MYDIIGLGELLIDFIEAGKSKEGFRLFEQMPGGAVANVMCAISKLGAKAAFLGKVGDDMHGTYLCEVLKIAGVNISGIVNAPDVFTTLAFVALDDKGERSFSFARKPGADTCFMQEEIDLTLIEASKIFHFGSLSLTNEPVRSATLFALKKARASSKIISYDPNYRLTLWQNEQEAKDQMCSVLAYVDAIKISEEEVALLTGSHEPEEGAIRLYERGIPCVVITLGDRGALVCVNGQITNAEGFSVNTVDTTGAGDAFWGSFLYQLIVNKKTPSQLTLNDAKAYATFANAAAALCVQKRGAINALPTLLDIERLLMTGGM